VILDHSEASENRKCLQALHATDPRRDKSRIETIKGGLLEDAYNWVFDNAEFKRWCHDQESQLLWIKGDPGKGKTMLLCGIINELTKSALASDTTVVFFFCQATDARINHATAILRGLIFMLVDQHPALVSHVRREYDKAGEKVFKDANAWEALLGILTSILRDPLLQTTYLIIDALDECTAGLSRLLDFIVEKSSFYPHVKWLVSSRNWPSIERTLETAPRKERLCLELNEASVSKAVASFIHRKVQTLKSKKNYSDDIRDAVTEHLLANAHGTFLWVALVCEELAKFNVSRRAVQRKLKEFPAGLDQLYQRMLDQIGESEDAELCKSILSVSMTVYRPITLDELGSYIDFPDDIELSDLEEIIGLCGSFLTLRGSTIFLVHQSAKDFLRREAVREIFPHGEVFVHHSIFSKSLEAMNRTLRRDIYGLVYPGYPIERVKPPDPEPLAAIQYACLYWVDHLQMGSRQVGANVPDDLEESGLVDTFFRKNYLYWLEAISLLRSLSEGLASMLRLEHWIKVRTYTH
jgi:archaellum biogenesis ATPase FlaH